MWLLPDAAPTPAPTPPAASVPAPTEPPTPTPIAEPEPPTLTSEFARGLAASNSPGEDAASPSEVTKQAPFASQTGLAFEMRIESGYAFSGSGLSTMPAWSGGIFVGYLGNKITIGAGIDVQRSSQENTLGGVLEKTAQTSFLFVPGIRYVLARSIDRRTEFLGQLDFGIGGVFLDDGNDLTENDSYDHIRLQLAPALRHWVTTAFAFGASVGFRYDDFSRVAEVGAGMTGEESFTSTGVFGSLQLTGVF